MVLDKIESFTNLDVDSNQVRLVKIGISSIIICIIDLSFQGSFQTPLFINQPMEIMAIIYQSIKLQKSAIVAIIYL